MKYTEYKKSDFGKIADEILSFWQENKIFEQSVSLREGQPVFNFYEGPPSANGVPGIHHVMARTVKDIFCRYKTLKGFQVKRKAGWDTHGLPVELKVEKDLGITKEDIGTKISIADYNQKCREAVMKFKAEWDELTQRIGYWVDLDTPYLTFARPYIESVWHLLKRLYDKSLLYKGYTVQPYSPAAGTGLSSHELNLPGCYKNVKDTSITAQFSLLRNQKSEHLFDGIEEIFLLAWTTTPWTLPANSALAVGEKITYLKVRTYNPYTHNPITVILAKDVFAKHFEAKDKALTLANYAPGDKRIPYQITAKLEGKDLLGLSYEQLLPYVRPEGKAFVIIPADFVTTEDGTGIVHIAPVFGADDFRVAKENGIAPILVKDENGNKAPLVNKQGRFVEEVTDFAGCYVKAEYYSEALRQAPDFKPTDVRIAIKLKTENKAFRVEKYTHSYPHCWRTDKPILYYPLDAWFIRTTAVKERLVALNKTINWKPAATGTGRFGNWLENLVDWNLSRTRYWGTPLPIWRTEDGKEEICIGAIATLEKEVEKSLRAGLMDAQTPGIVNGKLAEDFDLHRPYVDNLVLLSPSGKPMYREKDLIDVWFDSGAMPFAQWHYPFENQDAFKESFPADYISEGVDQTRGWFFTLHTIAGMLENSVAFKNVVSTGLVLDADGQKMSKRLGNAIDPFEILAQFGPDIPRWYMIENAPPWDNLKFDTARLAEIKRKFFGTLYNTYAFFALYANLDNFSFAEAELHPTEKTESDRWILSRLHSLILETDAAFADYEPTKAVRALQDFTLNDLSNWYVRLNRKRFWKGEYEKDKISAYQTLYTCLKTLAKLISPVAPFYADRLYQDLNKVSGQEEAVSVHLTDFPQARQTIIDKNLEEKMSLAQTICSLVHALRKKEKIKVRQPLSRILIPDLNTHLTAHIKSVEETIKSEVNIKKIEFIDNSSDILVKKIKPNFKVIGQRYGQKVKQIAAAIGRLSAADIDQIEKEKHYALTVGGETIPITPEEVIIQSEDIPGWSVVSEGLITVALDVTINEALRQEGIAREMVNRIQNQRKDMGLEVQDRIKIEVLEGDKFVESALKTFDTYICTETQADLLQITTAPTAEECVFSFDDYKVTLCISKII